MKYFQIILLNFVLECNGFIYFNFSPEIQKINFILFIIIYFFSFSTYELIVQLNLNFINIIMVVFGD